MEARKLDNLSVAEYLAIEMTSGDKYEYHDGTIFALAGGTFNHGTICGNIFGELRNKVKDRNKGCKAYTSEIKVYIKKDNSYVYPDAMVVCDEIEHPEDNKDAVANPKLIVEVLSKSTSNYDRGAKFHKYRQLESLEEYILIEQESYAVEIYKRVNDLWKISRIVGVDAILHLSSIDIDVEMTMIYEGVEL